MRFTYVIQNNFCCVKCKVSEGKQATMSSQPEPISMPQMPKYQPQVDIDPDDPDNYMMLVPANINTKLPISQLGIL